MGDGQRKRLDDGGLGHLGSGDDARGPHGTSKERAYEELRDGQGYGMHEQ